MKAPKQLLTVLLVASTTACAALTSERQPEENADMRLDRGLFALDAGRYSAAFEDLAWVYNHCTGHEAGSRALLALAALELDARNEAARPRVGTELLGRAIRDPGTARWVRPLAETTFLSSLALGAPGPADGEEGEAVSDDTTAAPADTTRTLPADTAAAAADVHEALLAPPVATTPVRGCGALVSARGEDWEAPPLPELPGPSMAALLATSQARRDSVTATAQALRNELATVRERLRVTEEELERIRKTLKP